MTRLFAALAPVLFVCSVGVLRGRPHVEWVEDRVACDAAYTAFRHEPGPYAELDRLCDPLERNRARTGGELGIVGVVSAGVGVALAVWDRRRAGGRDGPANGPPSMSISPGERPFV